MNRESIPDPVFTVFRFPILDSRFTIHDSRLFTGLPDEILVGRYHSWIISEKGFPDVLEITARDENNYIMALQHKNFDIQGVQFHPESIMTTEGKKLLKNFLSL